MTEKKLYTCDVCHTYYESKEDARECEKGHILSTVINTGTVGQRSKKIL